jgi:hypothetical protein
VEATVVTNMEKERVATRKAVTVFSLCGVLSMQGFGGPSAVDASHRYFIATSLLCQFTSTEIRVPNPSKSAILTDCRLPVVR